MLTVRGGKMSPVKAEAMTLDDKLVEELEALGFESDPEVDQDLVFEVMAQRCPPADPA
jgi:hypothetical protein